MLLLFDLFNETTLILTTMVCTTINSTVTIFEAATTVIRTLVEGTIHLAMVSPSCLGSSAVTYIKQILLEALLDLGIDLVVFLFGW